MRHEASTKYQIGDVVYGTALGTVAQYSLAPANSIAKADSDSNWTPFELASLGVAYQSALQCLRKGEKLIKMGHCRKGNLYWSLEQVVVVVLLVDRSVELFEFLELLPFVLTRMMLLFEMQGLQK